MASHSKPGSQSRLVDLFISDRYYPILTVLVSHLGIAAVSSLCLVCRQLRGLKDVLLRNHLNINARLSDFVIDPLEFRSLLGKYDAVIYGPFTLDFLELSPWRAKTLDILIQSGQNAEEFTHYLQEEEGYNSSSQVAGVKTQNLLLDASLLTPSRIRNHAS